MASGLLLGVLGAWGVPGAALALVHEASISSSRIEIQGEEATVALTFTLEDALSLVKFRFEPGGLLSPEAYREKAPLLFDYLSRRFVLRSEGELGVPRLIAPVFPGALAIPRSSLRASLGLLLRYHFSRPVRQLTIRCTLFEEVVREARHLAELSDGRAFVFDRDRPEASFTAVAGSGSLLALRSWTTAVLALGGISLLILLGALVSRLSGLRRIRISARLGGTRTHWRAEPALSRAEGAQGPVQMHP